MVDRLMPLGDQVDCTPMSSLPEASTVALLDAAVHVARLADSSDPRLISRPPSKASGLQPNSPMHRVSSRYVGAAATAMSSSSTSP